LASLRTLKEVSIMGLANHGGRGASSLAVPARGPDEMVAVGYHRLFTHRGFETTRMLRAAFAVLGSMAVEGTLLEWVSTHRKHQLL
jgi:hypothetical protein